MMHACCMLTCKVRLVCLLTLSISLLFQEVLHTICSPSGQVLRIVIFKKNGTQAMVEYPLVQGLY